MIHKLANILFFIAGSVPTPEDYENAFNLKANVKFRNASAVGPEDSLETCDGVAGEVPKTYAKKYPSAEEAIELANQKIQDALSKAHIDAKASDLGGSQTKIPLEENTSKEISTEDTKPKVWGQKTSE